MRTPPTGRGAAAVALAAWTCAPPAAGDADLPFERVDLDAGFSTATTRVADVDGDGRADVVVSGDSVRVFRGDGAGGFERGPALDGGGNGVDVAAGDVDGDGWTDLVVANHDTGHVTVLRGSPSGVGAAGSVRVPVGVGPHPHAVVLADVDGDGTADLLVDDRDRRALRWFPGGSGGAGPPAGSPFGPGRPVPVGGDPYRGMAVVDVDGDGALDVVTPNPRRVALQRGDGTGGFEPWTTLEADGLRPFGVAVGDLDGDGRRDVVAGGGQGQGMLAVWRGTADGGFTPLGGSPYDLPRGPTDVAVGDVDGDGADDAVVAVWGEGLTVVWGGAPPLRTTTLPVDGNPWGVDVGDLDGDGRSDVTVALDGEPRITVLLSRPR